MRVVVALASILLLSSCGGPTGPSYLPVAGTWMGTIQVSNFGSQAARLTPQQSNQVVSGNWTADGDWNGTLAGTIALTGSFTGTLTISAPNPDAGSRCTGTATVGGAFTTSNFSMATNGFTGNCPALAADTTFLTHR